MILKFKISTQSIIFKQTFDYLKQKNTQFFLSIRKNQNNDRSLCPPVFAIGTYIIESHFFFCSSRLSLEEDGLPVVAFGTLMLLRSGQGGIAHHVGVDVSQLVDFVHNFVHVNAIGVGQLFVVAISARVQEHLVVLVLFRVQHVVALLAETYSYVPGSSVFPGARIGRRSHHFDQIFVDRRMKILQNRRSRKRQKVTVF